MNLKALLTFIATGFFISAYSQSDSTYYQLGVARATAGKFDEAILLFTKAIEQNPEDPYAWFNRGLTKSFLEQHEEAILDFTKTIEIEPSYKKAYLNRGIEKRKLLDFDSAQEDFKLAIIKSPNYSEAYYHRGYIFELLGNKDSACKYYEIALSFGLKQIDSKIEICKDKKKTFEKHIVKLYKNAESKDYGFSEKNPIKVGGSPLNQREYLSLLRDVKGNPIQFQRKGSCCGYKLESAAFGMALLDRYEIIYFDENNIQQKAYVYITFYEYEEPKILFGFKTINRK